MERFWSKVDKTGDCWVWTAARFRTGYGMFLWERRLVGAHRVAWMLTHGAIPEGQMVLHSCDNRACVRLAHLSLGSHRENMDQMVARLRYEHGEGHHSNRLTEAQVREIKRRLRDGEEVAPLSREFGVTYTAIHFIKIGRNWKWLDAA